MRDRNVRHRNAPGRALSLLAVAAAAIGSAALAQPPQPARPAQPVQPGQQAQPAQPPQPAQPAQPVQPLQPAQPPQAPQSASRQSAADAARELDEARRALEAAQRDLADAERAAGERNREAREERSRAAEERERQRRAVQEESTGELERARRELEAARRNLEEAAREVARRSARAVGPIVQDFQLQWLGAGQRALLGIVIEDDAQGVRVTGVSPGGPAEEAGVMIGDVIVSIDGRSLVDDGRRPSRALIEHLSDIDPGTTVALEVARGGETRVIDVETREREDRIIPFEAPRVEVFTNLFRQGPWSSMELVSLTPELGAYFGTERGLLVVRAPDDDSLMLEDGDVILTINGREPNSPEHAMRILGTFERGETIELTIMRHRQQMTLEIPVEDGAQRGTRPRGDSA